MQNELAIKAIGELLNFDKITIADDYERALLAMLPLYKAAPELLAILKRVDERLTFLRVEKGFNAMPGDCERIKILISTLETP